MMRWKYPASWALTITSALFMAAPAQCEEFSPPPLAGNYVLIQSIPEVNMEAREFSQELFFPNQKIHLGYHGVMEEEGYDVFQGQEEFTLTFYPPFPIAMCRQERWGARCQNNNTYIPFEPIKQGMGVRTDTPLDDEMEDLAPILKSQNSKTERNDIIRYGMTFLTNLAAISCSPSIKILWSIILSSTTRCARRRRRLRADDHHAPDIQAHSG